MKTKKGMNQLNSFHSSKKTKQIEHCEKFQKRRNRPRFASCCVGNDDDDDDDEEDEGSTGGARLSALHT